MLTHWEAFQGLIGPRVRDSAEELANMLTRWRRKPTDALKHALDSEAYVLLKMLPISLVTEPATAGSVEYEKLMKSLRGARRGKEWTKGWG
jgi:hypothetical protein